MQVNYEILELFPTPVYTTIIPNKFSNVIAIFDKQNLREDSDHGNYGFRSKDSYILDKIECLDLANFILSNATIFAEQLGFDYKEYRFSQSWVSVKTPFQQHSLHTHPNSLISGVLYYGPVEKNTSAIKFHKNIGVINASYISPKKIRDKRNHKYAQEEFSILFEPGLLILFPSYFAHSVPINKTNTSRYSLAFNVVPTIGFGEEENLTELKF